MISTLPHLLPMPAFRPSGREWKRPPCEFCELPATHTDQALDARLPGHAPGEAGFRSMPLCPIHARERADVATSRLEMILAPAGHADALHTAICAGVDPLTAINLIREAARIGADVDEVIEAWRAYD